MEVPGAAQHTDADKAGYLTKLSSRSFPYIPQWKRRYCVLTKAKLYYYEREDSKQGEKSSGVINLEYFDQVAEAGPKDCKKATNVFVITSQDRSFFDPGRHLFSADTLPDMKDWIRKLQTALDQIRNNNRPANSTSTSTSTKEGGKRRKEEVLEIKENNTLTSASKERKKKKEDSHRQRKTARVGASEEGVSPGVMAGVVEHPRSPPAKGIQLPGLAVPQGIQLPGMTAPKKVEVTEPQKEAMEVDDEDGLPTAGPTLTCVTKRRVRGPSGRRAPQNRRTQIAAATQKRASSLTALEFQELNDTRSESSQGSPSRDSEGIQGSSGDLQSPVRDLAPIAEVVTFDDIDNELFFNKERVGRGETDEVGGEPKVTKRSSSSKVNFEDQALRKSKSRSRNGTLFGTKLSRFRETVVSFKRSRFDTKDTPVSRHPDEADSSRWCTIL